MKDITVVYSINEINENVQNFIDEFGKQNFERYELIIVSQNENIPIGEYKVVADKNVAINIAEGSYITFIDSFVDIAFNEISDKMEKFRNGFDIVISGYCFYSEEVKSSINSIITNNLGNIPLKLREQSFSPLKKCDFSWNINNEIFNKFYRREFLLLNNITFKNNFEINEFVFDFETLLKASKIACIAAPVQKKISTKNVLNNVENTTEAEQYMKLLLPENEGIKALFYRRLSNYYKTFEHSDLSQKINDLEEIYKEYISNHSKLTVIITFYNVAPYVKDCMESLINQTYENIEILCVDDCSSDNTVKELEKYAKIDNRIRIINREKNGGAAAARNTGIKAAKGDFITFVDGDDWIARDTYKFCMDKINKINADFVMYNTLCFNQKQNKPIARNFFEIVFWKNWNNDDYALSAGDSTKNIYFGNMSACNKVYRKRFLDDHNILFEENVEFEDYKFHAVTMFSAERIGIINKPLYVYRTERPGSTCNTIYNSQKIFHLFDVFDYLDQVLKDNGVEKDFYYALLEFKFELFNFWYSFVPFLKSKRMFVKIQDYFRKIDFEKLDYKKYSSYTHYDILMDFLTSNWFVMYFKSRFFNGNKNVIKKLKTKIDNL